jgi:uncharacterized membrane protein YeaQ/YmgE (transglycosylase-associated protein family)
MFFILGWIFFGALTGWIASLLVHRQGQGCIVNMALGLVGAVVGGYLFKTLTGFPFLYEFHSLMVQAIVAVIGAVIVLLAWNAISGRR